MPGKGGLVAEAVTVVQDLTAEDASPTLAFA